MSIVKRVILLIVIGLCLQFGWYGPAQSAPEEPVKFKELNLHTFFILCCNFSVYCWVRFSFVFDTHLFVFLGEVQGYDSIFDK